MQIRLASIVTVVALALVGLIGAVAVPAATASVEQVDDAVPPGNPVVGSERPGDVEPESSTRYGLWILLAACLIGAGTLLVTIERWERRRPTSTDASEKH